MSWRLKSYLGGFVIVLAVSLATHLINYDKPAALFWDENFHIASAQRYLNGVFFMEPHPPLGKLLIAAGEWLVDANDEDNQFMSVEKAESLPKGFSFLGYRLFPTFLGSLIAPVLCLLVIVITGRVGVAIFIGFLAAFDNALIVHNRGAMLDAPLILALVLGALAYFCARKYPNRSLQWYLLLGVSCGVAVSIKVNGGVLFLFAFALLLMQRRFVTWIVWILCPALLVYLSVWFIHFYIAHSINSKLQQNGLFDVTPAYAAIVQSGESRSLSSLLWGIREGFAYTSRYQEGVPHLDHCKDDESGSEPIFWPLGGRTINYRWERYGGLTQYLYLVPNPIAWTLGLLGVCGSLLLLVSPRWRKKSLIPLEDLSLLIIVYLTCWLSPYLLPRVFYLYHYFLALIISWILLAVFLSTLRWVQTRTAFFLGMLGVGGAYAWISPLTYYGPITDNGLRMRALLDLWDLRCPGDVSAYQEYCKENLQERRRTDPEWKLYIGELKANHIEQGVGDPSQDAGGISVITRSKLQFPINKRYAQFNGDIVVVGDLLKRELEVQIIADGATIYQIRLSLDQTKAHFSVPLNGKSVLILVARIVDASNPPVSVRWENAKLDDIGKP